MDREVERARQRVSPPIMARSGAPRLTADGCPARTGPSRSSAAPATGKEAVALWRKRHDDFQGPVASGGQRSLTAMIGSTSKRTSLASRTGCSARGLGPSLQQRWPVRLYRDKGRRGIAHSNGLARTSDLVVQTSAVTDCPSSVASFPRALPRQPLHRPSRWLPRQKTAPPPPAHCELPAARAYASRALRVDH
jgi:hypothetical protein